MPAFSFRSVARHSVLILSLLLFIIWGAALPVFARQPPPWLTVEVIGLSETVCFVDLLIPLDTQDADYVAFHNEYAALYSIGMDSGIAQYNEDGYVSYTFHYKNAISQIERGNFSQTSFLAQFEHRADGNGKAYYEFCKRFALLKVALLGQDGDILGITEAFQVANLEKGWYFDNHIRISATTQSVVENGIQEEGPWAKFFRVIFRAFLLCPILNAAVKMLFARLLGLKPLRRSVGLGIGTGIVLVWTWIFAILFNLSEGLYLPVACLVVCVIEIGISYIMYCIYEDYRFKQVLLYALLANLASSLVFLFCWAMGWLFPIV